VRRRPTLVQNAETLAQLALVARHGPDRFNATGVPGARGTVLVTVSGAVQEPGVVEVAGGTLVRDVLELAGGLRERIGSVVLGGYFGAWLPAAQALALTLDPADLAPHGAALGAGVLIAVPESVCGVSELARVMAWLAAESAHQCGPCSNGLPAIAGALARLCEGRAGEGTREQILRWAGLVQGRGACRHPDGAVRLLRTALRTLDADLSDHARHGPCDDCDARPLLATPSRDRLAA
jgi:NADH:ubiquinone oxidoreductase subunit F (NADH-binding)